MYEESSRNEYIAGLETDIKQVLRRVLGVHDLGGERDPHADPATDLYDWSAGRALADPIMVSALVKQVCREVFQWRAVMGHLNA